MDKLLYVSMNGANNSMHQMEVLSNNLANINTTGFRADSTAIASSQVKNRSNADQSRVYASVGKTFTDFTQGPMLSTQRDLDIAVEDEGFIAVQAKNGGEGYTRNGNLHINEDGVLQTGAGDIVMGGKGAIMIPTDAEKIHIGEDGTITAKLPATPIMIPVDQIKLVNPDLQTLHKGMDGLFHLADNAAAEQDSTVKIQTGVLEGSNVNAIAVLTQIIDLSRSYEIHTGFMKTMIENAGKSNQLLSIQ